MIAAIYARKSTDENVADEGKSVTQPVERGEDVRDGEAAGAFPDRTSGSIRLGHDGVVAVGAP